MFDIAWSEMLVVAMVLIIVVGPRDLPKVMRGIARLYGKARSLAGKFRADMDSLAREVELEELRRKVRMYEFQDPGRELTRLVDPDLPGTPAPVPGTREEPPPPSSDVRDEPASGPVAAPAACAPPPGDESSRSGGGIDEGSGRNGP